MRWMGRDSTTSRLGTPQDAERLGSMLVLPLVLIRVCGSEHMGIGDGGLGPRYGLWDT